MDTVQFEIKFDYSPDFQSQQLAIEAIINGKSVVPWTDTPVDVLSLLSSLDGPGEYFIWTCTCGIAECAGIDKGVSVTYSPTSVSWKSIELPMMDSKELVFDKAIYILAVHQIWAEYVGGGPKLGDFSISLNL